MDMYAQQFNLAVAAELRAERSAKQITVAALAESAGVPEVSLLRYLNGQRDIPVPALAAIANALNVGPGEILDRAAKRVEREQDNGR